MKIKHEIEPFFDKNSKVLILGSIPSVKSREIGFYYAFSKNRFWKTLTNVFNEKEVVTIEDKKKFLKKHHIALWDVLSSCSISGSSDSSIKNPKVNDINLILNNCNIEAIFTTGRKAYDLYKKYCFKHTKKEAFYLPSTSPANCKKNIDEILIEQYSKIKNYTD